MFNKKKGTEQDKVTTKKEIGITAAVFTLAIMIACMLFTVAVLEKQPHVRLLLKYSNCE